jgi:hypothetical protein
MAELISKEQLAHILLSANIASKFTIQDVINLLPESIVGSLNNDKRLSLSHRILRKLRDIGAVVDARKGLRDKTNVKKYMLDKSVIENMVDLVESPEILEFKLEIKRLQADHSQCSKKRKTANDLLLSSSSQLVKKRMENVITDCDKLILSLQDQITLCEGTLNELG